MRGESDVEIRKMFEIVVEGRPGRCRTARRWIDLVKNDDTKAND